MDRMLFPRFPASQPSAGDYKKQSARVKAEGGFQISFIDAAIARGLRNRQEQRMLFHFKQPKAKILEILFA